MTDEQEMGDVGKLIHSYTRQQAIDDGFLVDVSEMAREVGILYAVALTTGVYESYVVVPPKVCGQDVSGRLHDVVWMLACAIRRQRDAREIRYELFVRNDKRRARRVELKAICGPGDDAEPVITVMHPWED